MIEIHQHNLQSSLRCKFYIHLLNALFNFSGSDLYTSAYSVSQENSYSLACSVFSARILCFVRFFLSLTVAVIEL